MDQQTFGGCEGPDAMYVKLISSDGHEFIVKREHALTSGTIKGELKVQMTIFVVTVLMMNTKLLIITFSISIVAMLSGPGQFAENEANEVNFREIPWVKHKL